MTSPTPISNGRVIPLERNITERVLLVQNWPQGCIFYSPTKAKIPNVWKFQMKGSILSVPLLLLRFGTSPRNIHKGDERMSLLGKLHGWLIIFLDNILLMAFSKKELTLARNTLIYFQNLGLLINCKKIVLETCQNIQFLGMEINSIEMTLTLSREKIGKIVQQAKIY